MRVLSGSNRFGCALRSLVGDRHIPQIINRSTWHPGHVNPSRCRTWRMIWGKMPRDVAREVRTMHCGRCSQTGGGGRGVQCALPIPSASTRSRAAQMETSVGAMAGGGSTSCARSYSGFGGRIATLRRERCNATGLAEPIYSRDSITCGGCESCNAPLRRRGSTFGLEKTAPKLR